MDSSRIVTIVALFSLAWFLLGIIIGRGLGRKNQIRGEGRSRRNRDDEGRNDRDGTNVELYVGNLSYDVDEKEMRRAFENHGKVASARIIKNKFNGKSRGYGFVEMPDRGHAMAAIRALNGNEVKGRRIVVNEAKSEPR
jgi:RNA recognition motif-containing protein